MADYEWEKIFKNKTEKELINIYSGNSHLSLDAEIYAGLELKNRNYNFQEIERIHKRKVEELKMEISNFENLNFENSKYHKNQTSYGITLLLLMILTAFSLNTFTEFEYYKLIPQLIISLVGFFGAKWNFKQFKKNKEKSIIERTELLKRISKVDSVYFQNTY